MAIPPSGPLGFSAINTELGLAPNAANSSINSPVYRTLANVPSGQISVSDFYGKSPVVALDVEYMVISGGGGGGAYSGGGGGAGGLITNVSSPFGPSASIDSGANTLVMSYCLGESYAITIGGGGTGGIGETTNDNCGGNGGTSRICALSPGTFDTRQVCGGGGGGGGSAATPGTTGPSCVWYGFAGGSGGGHSTRGQTDTNNNCSSFGTAPTFSGNITLKFGTSGGCGQSGTIAGSAGGGGGVCSSGQQGVSNTQGGNGGEGILWRNIACVGGGGGGGTWYPLGGAIGGCGGCVYGTPIAIGGCGAQGNTCAVPAGNRASGGNAVAFTGSGGGGGGRVPGMPGRGGGLGGSGKVIIGYPGTTQRATGGDCICIDNGKTYHIFGNTGSFTWC